MNTARDLLHTRRTVRQVSLRIQAVDRPNGAEVALTDV